MNKNPKNRKILFKFSGDKDWLKDFLLMTGLGLLVFLVVAFLFGFVTMALWNYLLPDIFGLPKISYWQAVGLLIFPHLFFINTKVKTKKKKKGNKKQRFKAKWESMSEEEQAAFLKEHVKPSQELN